MPAGQHAVLRESREGEDGDGGGVRSGDEGDLGGGVWDRGPGALVEVGLEGGEGVYACAGHGGLVCGWCLWKGGGWRSRL